MKKVGAMLFLLAFLPIGSVRAQTPTGTIAGVVTDPAGAAVSQAAIRISNGDTGLLRNLTSSAEGTYSTSALPSGLYLVTADGQPKPMTRLPATIGRSPQSLSLIHI